MIKNWSLLQTASVYLYSGTFNLWEVQAFFLNRGQFDGTCWCLSDQVVETILCSSIVWNNSQKHSLANIVVSYMH